MKDIDNIFDEKKLEKSIRKAKLKSTIKITIIAIIIFIVGTFLNTFIGIKYSQKVYEATENNVELSIPNGYISESNDVIGFLGGTGTYKIAKNICGKTVVLEDHYSSFGLLPPVNYMRQRGGSFHYAEDWPVRLWNNGYKKLRFFHPELHYKEYQNDLAQIDEIPDGKIIEMAISFDKPYAVAEFFKIQSALEPVSVTWLWLNEFTDEKFDEFKQQIEDLDGKSAGIYEQDIIGISSQHVDNLNSYTDNIFNQQFTELINKLSLSNNVYHKELYAQISKRTNTIEENPEVIGVIVHGTKEELKELIDCPIIKATSFGVVTDPIY